LRLLSFPAWRLRLNGQPVASVAAREDGLIVIPVSAGPITLTADWATTGDVLLARILSGFFALLFAALALLVRRMEGLRTSTASIGSRLG
jgi:hypothetical protein